MELDKKNISYLIGLFLSSDELEIEDLENEGLDIDELMEHNTTIVDYEGHADMYKEYKMNLVKKLYKNFK